MTIASLIVDVLANTVQLQQDVEKIHGSLDGLTTLAANVGKALAAAFTVTALLKVGKDFIDFASNLTDLSAKTGITTTGLQKLQAVFKDSGIGIESVTSAAAKLAGNLVGGDKAVVATLDKMGLSLTALKQMAPEDQFMTVADAIGNMQNKGEQIYASKTLLGKGGVELLAGLNGHLKETADHLTNLIDEKTIADADTFGDQLGQMGTQFMALAGAVLGPLLPGLIKLGEGLMWVGNNVIKPVLTVAVEAVTVALAGLWAMFANVLARLAEAAQKIPIVGKHMDGLGDAAAWLRKSADEAGRYVDNLGKSTTSTGASAKVATPHLLGLGSATDAAAKASDKAAKAQRDFEKATTISLKTYAVAASEFDIWTNRMTKGLIGQKLAVLETSQALTTQLTPSLGDARFNMRVTAEKAEEAAQAMEKSFREAMQRIPQHFIDAFTGGGGIMGALKAIGTDLLNAIVSNILKPIETAIGNWATRISDKIVDAFMGPSIHGTAASGGTSLGTSWGTAFGMAAGIAILAAFAYYGISDLIHGNTGIAPPSGYLPDVPGYTPPDDSIAPAPPEAPGRFPGPQAPNAGAGFMGGSGSVDIMAMLTRQNQMLPKLIRDAVLLA